MPLTLTVLKNLSRLSVRLGVNMSERKRKPRKKAGLIYSKNKSFENLEAVQQLALNRKGKDDEINPDISVYLKAEELKGKLCGLYTDKENNNSNINVMGSVKIDGITLDIKVGEDVKTDIKND